MSPSEDKSDIQARLAGFRQGIEKRGWTEGRNVRIDVRFAAGRVDQFQILAKELVALKPDVILAETPRSRGGTAREPHEPDRIRLGLRPDRLGFVASLARPGGNVTGLLQYEAGITGKWLAMLKEITPRLARAALVLNPKTTANDYFLRAAEASASSLAIEVVPKPIETGKRRNRSQTPLPGRRTAACYCRRIPRPYLHRDLIIALAARYRLPAVYALRVFVAAGGLMSYGTDQAEIFRQAALYVDRILRGAHPADLPVQAPTKFETTLNLRTAKALGLSVPPGLLLAADEVIE